MVKHLSDRMPKVVDFITTFVELYRKRELVLVKRCIFRKINLKRE